MKRILKEDAPKKIKLSEIHKYFTEEFIEVLKANEFEITEEPKKTRLIPFDYEKYILGAKVVFRGSPQYKIIFISIDTDDQPIFCCYKGYSGSILISNHQKDGGYYQDSRKCDMDLMIAEEVEEKTFWVNMYSNGCCGCANNSLEDSKKRSVNSNIGFVGSLKITYTDEDLIK